MTRQEANLEILHILDSTPSEENLRIADMFCTPADYLLLRQDIEDLINEWSSGRWCQIMWKLDLNLGTIDNGDRFSEESIVTLNKLKR